MSALLKCENLIYVHFLCHLSFVHKQFTIQWKRFILHIACWKNNDALFILLECVSFYSVTCINIQIHIFLPKIYSFKRFRFVTYEWGYIIQCLFVNLTFPYILHTCWGQETIWHRETDTTAQINVIFMNFYFPLETPFI